MTKNKNWGRKRSQRRNQSRKNQNVSILSSDSACDSVVYDPLKTRLSESETEFKRKNKPIKMPFISSTSACDFNNLVFFLIDGVVSEIRTLFSLVRKVLRFWLRGGDKFTGKFWWKPKTPSGYLLRSVHVIFWLRKKEHDSLLTHAPDKFKFLSKSL